MVFKAPFSAAIPRIHDTNPLLQFDKLVGMAMLAVATTVFLYYTFWTLFMVFWGLP